jgi:hypothetical protein
MEDPFCLTELPDPTTKGQDEGETPKVLFLPRHPPAPLVFPDLKPVVPKEAEAAAALTLF